MSTYEHNSTFFARVCLMVLTFASAGIVTAAGATAATNEHGKVAPDCAWTLQSGKQISNVNQFRGKVVYVDFWASWCAPCAVSFPFMNSLQSADASKGLEIVAVNMDEKPADAQRFLAAHPVLFDVAVGANAACAKAFGVTDMPSSFIIDRSGVIRLTHRGFRRDDPDALRSQVDALLKE